jgi:metal-responsive CopG/Arc/MetJ family transcriptional regulator
MRTITLKLPESLALRLNAIVRRRSTTRSAVVREALEALLGSQPGAGESCAELAGDLVGSLRGLPRDLSSSPRHLRGYGR